MRRPETSQWSRPTTDTRRSCWTSEVWISGSEISECPLKLETKVHWSVHNQHKQRVLVCEGPSSSPDLRCKREGCRTSTGASTAAWVCSQSWLRCCCWSARHLPRRQTRHSNERLCVSIFSPPTSTLFFLQLIMGLVPSHINHNWQIIDKSSSTCSSAVEPRVARGNEATPLNWTAAISCSSLVNNGLARDGIEGHIWHLPTATWFVIAR